MSPWQPARICSRPGAAHQRRGQVCQDWSAAVELRSLDGLPVQVMAVADGHGGARYHRSDIGSRLACTAALTAVAATLETSRLADSAAGQPMEHWRRWLQQALPLGHSLHLARSGGGPPGQAAGARATRGPGERLRAGEQQVRTVRWPMAPPWGWW